MARLCRANANRFSAIIASNMHSKPAGSLGRRLSSVRVKSALSLFLFSLALSLYSAPTAVRTDRWLNDVKFLASGAMKGRGSGSAELEKAGAYIAEEFEKAGLQPLKGSYLQPFSAVVGT